MRVLSVCNPPPPTNRFKPSWARVVEPSDEAVFNWLALNYNNGRLGEPTHAGMCMLCGL